LTELAGDRPFQWQQVLSSPLHQVCQWVSSELSQEGQTHHRIIFQPFEKHKEHILGSTLISMVTAEQQHSCGTVATTH